MVMVTVTVMVMVAVMVGVGARRLLFVHFSCTFVTIAPHTPKAQK